MIVVKYIGKRVSNIIYNKRFISHLKDVNILDLSSILAGPFCTQNLADLGANVIKIEKPSGDDTRHWQPPSINGISSYFLCANRNKKSLAIDMKTSAGAKIVRDLAINWADVLVENFIPGKLKKYGLDYESLNELNPRLIYASLTGFGQTGPDSKRPGYDIMIAARGGLMSFTGTKETSVKVGVAMTDLCTGLYMQGAILAALYQRCSTNEGQHIDVSLLASQVALLANIGQNFLINNKQPQRHGTAHESIVPYQKFTTLDKDIIVGALNDGQWNRLFIVIENIYNKDNNEYILQLKDMNLYGTNPLRVKNRKTLLSILEKCFQQFPSSKWLQLLDEQQVPCAPLSTLEDVFYNDKHIQHLNMIEETNSIKTIRHPIRYDNKSPNIRSVAPFLGEHNDEILKDILNMNSDQIKQLKDNNVIFN